MATKTTKTASAVVEAEEQVARLAVAVGEWEVKRDDTQARLAAHEEQVGDAVVAAALDGTDRVGELAGTGARLRAELDTIDRTLDAARDRKRQAECDLLVARAGELRAEASKLHAEADRRQARTDELLAQLEEHEGVRPVWPRNDVPLVTTKGAGERSVSLPRTEGLRIEARKLEGRAAKLEHEAGVGPAPVLSAIDGTPMEAAAAS